jgi:hypothetical protein
VKTLFEFNSTDKFLTYFIFLFLFLDMAGPNFTPEEVHRMLDSEEGELMDTGTGSQGFKYCTSPIWKRSIRARFGHFSKQ